MSEYDSIINEMKAEMKRLLGSEIYNIVQVEKSKNISSAIYAIRTPDSEKIVYVGQTKVGISKRMHGHLRLEQTSDLQIMLKNYPDYPQDKTEYGVQYLEVRDERKRFFLENFIISVLQPVFNGKRL